MNNMVSTLSQTVSNTVSDIVQNPYKMEGVLGAVRTVAPLTSVSTCNKINGVLPFVERISSVLGMYSFLNKAQNYQPIQSLANKTPMEKVTSLISNGNIPIASILATPLVKNNMDKIIGAVAKNMVNNSMKNGNMNDMFNSFAKQMGNGNNQGNSNNNIDISKLMEMAGPILSSLNSSQANNGGDGNIDFAAIMSMMQPFFNSTSQTDDSTSANESTNNTTETNDSSIHNEDTSNYHDASNVSEIDTNIEAAEIKNKIQNKQQIKNEPLEIINRRRR